MSELHRALQALRLELPGEVVDSVERIVVDALTEREKLAREGSNHVQFMVNWANDLGLLEEGCFTFPDGLTVYAEDPEDGDASSEEQRE